MAAIVTTRNSTNVLKSFRRSLQLGLMQAGFALGSWLSPATTVQRAFRLFCTPMPGARSRALRADTLGAHVQELSDDRHRVATYTWGDPQRQPVVLFAHGWSSHGLRCTPWVRALREAGYAVVSFDQLAHGRSSGRRSNLVAFTETLRLVAAHHGRLAAVIGHSMGGGATALALMRGLQAERTVLLAPAADWVAAAERFGRFVGLAPGLARRIFSDYERRFDFSIDAMQVHANAPYIGCPALVVHDLEDRDVPWAEGERYARYWPQARLLTTTGLGHHDLVSDPGVIAAALAFMRGEIVGERVVSSPNLPFGVA